MPPRAAAMAPSDRRASIVAATLPLLREKGRAVSTKDIAKAAGIAEGTIFRVFDGKDELVQSCIREVFDTAPLHDRLGRIDPDLPLPDRLAAGVRVMQEHLTGIFSLMTMLHTTGQPMDRPRAGKHLHDREKAAAQIDSDFERLIGGDAGQLRLPAATVVGYLRMMTMSSVHPLLSTRGSTAEEIVDVVLHGVLRSAAEPPRDATEAVGSSGTVTSRGKK